MHSPFQVGDHCSFTTRATAGELNHINLYPPVRRSLLKEIRKENQIIIHLSPLRRRSLLLYSRRYEKRSPAPFTSGRRSLLHLNKRYDEIQAPKTCRPKLERFLVSHYMRYKRERDHCSLTKEIQQEIKTPLQLSPSRMKSLL
jgi:hypothetical protein